MRPVGDFLQLRWVLWVPCSSLMLLASRKCCACYLQRFCSDGEENHIANTDLPGKRPSRWRILHTRVKWSVHCTCSAVLNRLEWWGTGVVICLEQGANDLHMICIWSSWCHCHPIISCSSKIQNDLPFWYRLTQVVLEKRSLNGCSSSSNHLAWWWQVFDFDVSHIHWPTYLENYCLGVKRFALHEDVSRLPEARQSINRSVVLLLFIPFLFCATKSFIEIG